MVARYCIVLVTAPSGAPAQKISKQLVRMRLAACVTTVPRVGSIYRWKGKVETAREDLLIIKTRRALVKKIIRELRSVHPYAVPEIMALPILDGFKPYLTWVGDETKI